MGLSFLNKISGLFRHQSGATPCYSTVDGDLTDIELNIPQVEQSTAIDSDGTLSNPSNTCTTKDLLKTKYLKCKKKVYTLFVYCLNKYMEYPMINTQQQGTARVHIALAIDDFVMQFFLIAGFLLQTPIMWLIASILYFFSKKKTKKFKVWSAINMVLFILSVLYFVYFMLDPYGYYSNLPRIAYEYKNILSPGG